MELPWQPSENGFDFSREQIGRWTRRKILVTEADYFHLHRRLLQKEPWQEAPPNDPASATTRRLLLANT